MKVGILVFSIIEVVGLAGWLFLQDLQPGFLDVFGLLGIAVLFVGLFAEHIVTDNVLRSRSFVNLSNLPLGEIATFSFIETGIWATWLVLADSVNLPVSVVFLLLALFVEHTISKNVHERRPIFSRLFNAVTLPHTVVETVACSVWLVLARAAQPILGIGVLLVGSIIEHVISVRITKVLPTQP